MPTIFVAEFLVFLLMKIGILKNAEVAKIVGSENFLGIFNQFTPSIFLFFKESLFGTYLLGSSAYIGPLWTMNYEYLGTIYVIVACYFLSRSRVRWIFYLVNFLFFSNYWNYFIIGMATCDLFTNVDWKIIFERHKAVHFIFTAFGYLLFTCCNLNDTNKSSRFFFALGIMMFLLGFLNCSFAEKYFGSKFFCFGGKIAYSAYVIHWPIIETFSCGFFLFFADFANYNFVICVNLVLTLFIVVFVSFFFSKYIEPIGMRFLSINSAKSSSESAP